MELPGSTGEDVKPLFLETADFKNENIVPSI